MHTETFFGNPGEGSCNTLAALAPAMQPKNSPSPRRVGWVDTPKLYDRNLLARRAAQPKLSIVDQLSGAGTQTPPEVSKASPVFGNGRHRIAIAGGKSPSRA